MLTTRSATPATPCSAPEVRASGRAAASSATVSTAASGRCRYWRAASRRMAASTWVLGRDGVLGAPILREVSGSHIRAVTTRPPVAAANALSDVYAMGGRPLVALNLTAWPNATLPLELLAEVLRGGAEVAAEAGCLVVGGHSVDDPEPKYGMAVVGLADPARLLTVDRARPGDQLVLTKAIGTGVIATALKRGAPEASVVAATVDSMTTLNRAAGEAALAAGLLAATDVTGFGLLGHLHRMARASGVAAEIDAAAVPFLPGAAELAGEGFISGGTRNNQAFLAGKVELDPGVPPVVATLLHDAQTSGGLLLAVPPERLKALLADLASRELRPALVGRVVRGQAGRIRVRRLPPA